MKINNKMAKIMWAPVHYTIMWFFPQLWPQSQQHPVVKNLCLLYHFFYWFQHDNVHKIREAGIALFVLRKKLKWPRQRSDFNATEHVMN